MKILLVTPLYPPEIGGPAQYAFNLHREFQNRGHEVRVATFTFERTIPSFVRHAVFFCRVLPKVFWADRVISLDAASVGVPTVLASKIVGRKCIVRLGGDFLWESYIENSGKEISLDAFYRSMPDVSLKQKIIKIMTAFAIKNAEKIVVNTMWFGDIISSAYHLTPSKIICIENYFAGVHISEPTPTKQFLVPSRPIKLKNTNRLKAAFYEASQQIPEIELIDRTMNHDELQESIKEGYALVVPSFSDVSPNIILDGLAAGKPFIVTQHTGLNSRFENMGIFVDPFDQDSIKKGIIKMCNPAVYQTLRANIADCTYTHSWEQIADEFEKIIL